MTSHTWFRACVILLIATFSSEVLAGRHFLKVREIFPGIQGIPEAQYILLQMERAGQRRVANHNVYVYNSAGGLAATLTFPADVANGADDAFVLIATTEAEAAFGISADLVMENVLSPLGGRVCFSNFDCVSWGNYSGDSAERSESGTPFQRFDGLRMGRSAKRHISNGDPSNLEPQDDTNDSASDFYYSPAATPINNAGAAGWLPQLASLHTSVNAGTSTDKAILKPSSSSAVPQVVIRDGADGSLLATHAFSASKTPQVFLRIADASGNSKDELVLISLDQATGSSIIEAIDSADGSTVFIAQIAAGTLLQDMITIPDSNANGGNDLAVMLVDPSSNEVTTQVFDGNTGALLNTLAFGRLFSSALLASTNDQTGNGSPEIVRSGRHVNTGSVRADTIDSVSHALVTRHYSNKTFRTELITSLSAHPSSSGPVLAALERTQDTGDTRVTISDVNGVLGRTVFSSKYIPEFMAEIGDVNGDSINDLMVIGSNISSPTFRAELRDITNGKRIGFIYFANKMYSGIDFDLSPDSNGNNHVEINILGLFLDQQKIRVDVKDSKTGALLSRIDF